MSTFLFVNVFVLSFYLRLICINRITYLAAKLKHLKEQIKKWRRDETLKENQEMILIKEMVTRLEKEAGFRSLTKEEPNTRSNGLQKILELEKRALLDLKHKSKIRWTIDGDENTKFFHGYINSKNRRSRIYGLSINGRWSSDADEIKAEAFRFFKEKFHEKWVVRPKLINNRFHSISVMDAISLEARIIEA